MVSVLYSTTASLPFGSAKAYKVCASPLSIDWGTTRLYAKGWSTSVTTDESLKLCQIIWIKQVDPAVPLAGKQHIVPLV